MLWSLFTRGLSIRWQIIHHFIIKDLIKFFRLFLYGVRICWPEGRPNQSLSAWPDSIGPGQLNRKATKSLPLWVTGPSWLVRLCLFIYLLFFLSVHQLPTVNWRYNNNEFGFVKPNFIKNILNQKINLQQTDLIRRVCLQNFTSCLHSGYRSQNYIGIPKLDNFVRSWHELSNSKTWFIT